MSMRMTSSRRPSTRRSTALYSRYRQETSPKVYDVSDLESDEPVPSEEDEEETNKLEDVTYQSEEDEMDEEQDMMDEELEEEETYQPEETEEYIEEIEQMDDDIDVDTEEIDGDATHDDEDFEAKEESDEVDKDEGKEEDDDEQSDYEEEISSRKTRGGAQSQKQQPSSRKKGSIAETSSSSHGHRVLTKRQRAKLNENYQEDLLQLSMEPMRKKHMTEEEIALKKSEIARRKKNQSIQRAEQDKMDTINRLLHKQSTKRRTKDHDDTDSVHNDPNSTSSLPFSSFHYVNNAEGATLSIPIGIELPIQFEKRPRYPPPIPSCAFPGCNVPKKYCSVKTFEYACSMDHLHKLESKG